ncbi:hypothetical protein ACP70R_015701 [Stipagrostis hirtigluma subsp. patula]
MASRRAEFCFIVLLIGLHRPLIVDKRIVATFHIYQKKAGSLGALEDGLVPPLLGAEIHGFVTLKELVNSVTKVFEECHLLFNEEKTTMLLNLESFRWLGPADVEDHHFIIDSFFSIWSQHEWTDLMASSAAANGYWFYYIANGETYLEHDGAMKNRAWNNNQDEAHQINLHMAEVVRGYRRRRRSTLPVDFAERAGFATPEPGLMVIEYQ